MFSCRRGGLIVIEQVSCKLSQINVCNENVLSGAYIFGATEHSWIKVCQCVGL